MLDAWTTNKETQVHERKKLMKLQVLNAWTTQQHMITSITGERTSKRNQILR